ncbi:MAG TPA: hypothetical protein VGF38_11695, partial [Ktedonobacterales bacterium]
CQTDEEMGWLGRGGAGVESELAGMAEPTPPAQAHPPISLVHTWLTLAWRQMPQDFSRYSRDIPPSWVVVSLALGTVLLFIAQSLALWNSTLAPAEARTSLYFPSVSSAIAWQPVIRVSLYATAALLYALSVAFVLAVGLPATEGSLRHRFYQVLRPWSLAQVVRGAAELTVGLIILVVIIAGRASASSVTTISGILVAVRSLYVLGLTFGSLTAGSRRSPGAILGVILLITLVGYVLLYVVINAIAL